MVNLTFVHLLPYVRIKWLFEYIIMFMESINYPIVTGFCKTTSDLCFVHVFVSRNLFWWFTLLIIVSWFNASFAINHYHRVSSYLSQCTHSFIIVLHWLIKFIFFKKVFLILSMKLHLPLIVLIWGLNLYQIVVWICIIYVLAVKLRFLV